jgi:hypothetical protein
MKFVREIPTANITDKLVLELTNFGFVLVWKEDSIEVYADCSVEQAA